MTNEQHIEERADRSLLYPFGETIRISKGEGEEIDAAEESSTFLTLENGFGSSGFLPMIHAALGTPWNRSVRIIACWHPSGIWAWSVAQNCAHYNLLRSILIQASRNPDDFAKEPFIYGDMTFRPNASKSLPRLLLVCRGATPEQVEDFTSIIEYMNTDEATLSGIEARL